MNHPLAPLARKITREEAIELQARFHAEKDLLIWTIYQQPDGEDKFIVQISSVECGRLVEFLTADSLAALRQQLPPGLYDMGRTHIDDPAVITSYL